MFLLLHDNWEIRGTEKKGKGVFAKRDIAAGTIIGDYLGMVVPGEDGHKYEDESNFYTMYLSEEASIIPDLTKEGIHFINHSCAPTCWMYVYEGHTLYVAIRKIFAGEEITVDYMLDPLDKTCSPCTDICHCGAVLCRNTMHAGKKLSDAWEGFSEKERKKATYTIGKQLERLPTYPNSIPDNPIYTLFGNGQKNAFVVDTKEMFSIGEVRELIRAKGICLQFPKMNCKVLGVIDDLIITRSI
jgi:uncharacterized protein